MMSWDEFSENKPPTAAELRTLADQRRSSLDAEGIELNPLPKVPRNGAIAKSFWGKAWCRNLEAYSDYEYRLPRGRSYLRNGTVLDLQIEPQTVSAIVSGSELYELTVNIDPLAPETWAALIAKCQGQIGSLVELLQGKLSDEIMALVIDKDTGLFPQPSEIHFNCNCPDWADMCKHAAAALYGVGLRLDESPALLFKLRGVDHTKLLALEATTEKMTRNKSSRRRLDADAVSGIFDIELGD